MLSDDSYVLCTCIKSVYDKYDTTAIALKGLRYVISVYEGRYCFAGDHGSRCVIDEERLNEHFAVTDLDKHFEISNKEN